MEYLTEKFDNTTDGIRQKNARTQQLAAAGYRIISEQVENGHIKGSEQCCGALVCLPLIFLAGRTPGTILVTYGRETSYCTSCGNVTIAKQRVCPTCKADLSNGTVTDRDSARVIVARKKEAAQRTAHINKSIHQLDAILVDSLAIDHSFDWNQLKVTFSAAEPEPAILLEPPHQPFILHVSSNFPIVEQLIPSFRETRLRWEEARERNQQCNKIGSDQYDRDLDQWRRIRASMEQEQTAQVEEKKRAYLAKETACLVQYWARVLESSQYPFTFPRSGKFDYSPKEQRLVLDFALPSPTSLPQVGEVKYDSKINALKEIPVSNVWLTETYRGMIIKMALRTIYELFQSDVADALDSIAFNGSIRAIDRSIGQEASVFLICLEASKVEFATINLAQVEPEACFARLGGVLSENLAGSRTPLRSTQSPL